MTVIKMGMEGHMPSRQLGTLEINNTSGRDRQYTIASAGQSQRAWIFTSIHLVALLASCFHKLTMAGSGALLHRANQQCFEGAQCKGFGRGVGSSDDIPSAANSTKPVRRLQRRASTRRPCSSIPGGQRPQRKVLAELPMFLTGDSTLQLVVPHYFFAIVGVLR